MLRGWERVRLSLRAVPLVAGMLIVVSQIGCDDAAGVTQPIPFSHVLHVVDGEMACAECHRSVETGRAAGRPGVNVCGDCHDVMLGHSEEEQVVVSYVERAEEIPWRRVSHMSPAVLFSHARHVTSARIECQTCHGPMEEQDVPPPTPLVALGMDDCIDCHKEQAVRHDCNACHR